MSSNKVVTILDGSNGRALAELHGIDEHELFGKIWSSTALVLEEYHVKVVEVDQSIKRFHTPNYNSYLCQVHLSYMKAGAEIITTNSYATQPNYYSKGASLMRRELDNDKSSEELIREHAKLSAQLALQARQHFYQSHPDSQKVQVRLLLSAITWNVYFDDPQTKI